MTCFLKKGITVLVLAFIMLLAYEVVPLWEDQYSFCAWASSESESTAGASDGSTGSDSGAVSDTSSGDTGSDSGASTGTTGSGDAASNSGTTSESSSSGQADSGSDISSDTASPDAGGSTNDTESPSETPNTQDNPSNAGDDTSDTGTPSDSPGADDETDAAEPSSGYPDNDDATSDSNSTPDIGDSTGDSDGISDDPDTTPDNSDTGESSGDADTSSDNDDTGGEIGDAGIISDTPDNEESTNNIDEISAPSTGGGSGEEGTDQNQSSEEPIEEPEQDEVTTISQGTTNDGDPWGYILDAVTEVAVAGATVEVWKVTADGTLVSKDDIINETNPVSTDTTGKYEFTVKTTDKYQLKITKTGYVDYLSKIFDFAHDAVTEVEDLYLVPLVTDASGQDIILQHDLYTGGENITIIADNLTVNDNIIVDTRQVNNAGSTSGDSGSITLTGKESLSINTGASIRADVDAGSGYTPGTITLTAVNQTVNGLNLSNLTVPLAPTTASITVRGSVSGGDVVIKASTGLPEIPEVVDTGDYSADDWTIAKLKEYMDMIPLPVVVKMRDDQATVTIDSGAQITGSGKVTIESEADAQAKSQGTFSKEFIGYCKAKGLAETNVNDGAFITAGDNVLIRSLAKTTADLNVTVDNSKNNYGFSLALAVTDTDLTSHTTIAQGASISGKNVNIQALGQNYNHAALASTDYADGNFMAMLSLNFTDSDVKAVVDGNVTAAGEEITSPEDGNDKLTGGLGVLARLESDDLAKVVVGIGGSTEEEEEDRVNDEEAKSAKDMIIQFFQTNYAEKTNEADENNKNDSGANKSLQAAGACACSKVDNDVTVHIGSTADLKSGLDLEVKSELIETARTQTHSSVQGDNDEDESTTSNAISAAVSIGLYDNTATTTFAGQSDAKRNTVIRSAVSYPFLLLPLEDVSPGTFKDGLNLDPSSLDWNLAKDVLGLLEEAINSWTISTASGETTGCAGAVTYLEYNNTATTTIKDTARINQRTDTQYQSDDQNVAIDAATDLNQIIVVGKFDFGLGQDDLTEIAHTRGILMGEEEYPDSALVIPDNDQSVTGKAGIGGSILLSYITNNAAANVENGAQIHAGSNGKVDVTASNQVTSLEFVQSGGQAGKFGVAGSFALDNEHATVLATIDRGAVVDAGALNIKASDRSSHLNIVGGVIRSDGIGVGASVAINEITRNVGAGITQPEGSPSGSTSNIVIAGAMNIEAAAKGDILAATVAASLPAKAGDEAPDQSKDTADTTSTAPSSGSTGTGKSQGKYGIGASGAVSINEVNDTVKAFIDYSDKLTTGSLTVKATNETNLLALTGSAACTKSKDQNSGTLAGAYSQITLNGTTQASVIGTEMDTDALTLIAERIGKLWSISAGGANSPGKSGIAVAGSVSINNITNHTTAQADNMKGNVSGPTLVQAKDKSSMHVIAGAEGYGGRGGFGAAVAYNDLQNDTKASIINSNWQQQATLELIAENSIRAGPIDESFDISGNPAEGVEILAVAASLGISPKGNFGGAGTVAINRIRNTVEAFLKDSTCTFTDNGQGSFTSRDDSNIFSIAGAIGGAKNVGIGAAVAYNEIGNKAYTFIDGSTLDNPVTLSLITESGGIIKTLSLGASGAQDVALAGSASVNTINNDASAYIKDSTVTVINNISISSTGSAGIGSIAGGFAGAGKAAVGAAVAINNIGTAADPNLIKAYIENSQVTTTSGSLSLITTSNSIIKSISAGGAGAEKCAIGGAVSVNNIVNEIEAYIINCSDGVTAHSDITLDAADNSAVSVIAGSVAGAGTAAIAGAAATVEIGYYNPIDKTITYSKTRTYIENSQVTSQTGEVKLTSTSNSVIFNIAAGAGVAGTFGGQGSVSLNWIYNELTARIIDATVTAAGDISAKAVTIKRTTIPQGAIQPQSDDTDISTFDGDPNDTDSDDEDGQPTTHDISSIQALAGSVAGGGTAGVGIVVATNKIANLITAGISGSTITSSEGNVNVVALSNASIEAISAALAGAGTFAGAGSVSLNEINNQISSFIITSNVNAHNTGNEPVDGQLPGVYLSASDTSIIRSLSGGVGIGGSAGLGGAAAYNEIANLVKAYIEDCKTTGMDNRQVHTEGSVTIQAVSDATIETISAGGAFSGYAGVAGSVSINTIGNTVEAYIKNSTVNADDNIYILADSHNTIHGYGGALAGGLIGVSGAVVVNTAENTTRAYIIGSSVTARGTGSEVTVKKWNDAGDESTEDLKGLFVIADCDDSIKIYSGATAGGAGAVSGQTSVNNVKDTTQAFIAASSINLATDFGQWVKVKAHQGTLVDLWAGGLCVSGAGVGAAVDRTLIENTTRAFISDSDTSGANPMASNIYARELEVSARNREEVKSQLAGIALSGTASGAGAVSVVDLKSSSLADISRSKVYVLGSIQVHATDKAILDTKAVTVAGSAGAAGAASVVINTLSNTTKAAALGANLNATQGIEVKALSNDKISIMTGGVGVGIGAGGVGGVVSFNTMQNTTEAVIASSGVLASLINQDARFKRGGSYAPDTNQRVLVKAENTSTVDNTGLAGGAGLYLGGGAAVDVTKVLNRTAAYIGAGSKIYSRGDISIEAQAAKTINSKTAAVGAGLVGISGAISITTVGEAISSEGAGQFTGELRNQVNSDASVKNLQMDTNDTYAQSVGDKVNGLAAPDLDSILSTTQDTSGIITAAYVENGSATQAAEIVSDDGTVTIKASNHTTISGSRAQLAAGIVAGGASVTIINTYERTQALVGSYSTIRAQNLIVAADSKESATADSLAANGGLFAGGGNIAHVKVHPLVEASLGSYSNIAILNQAAVTAGITPYAKATVTGVTVAAGSVGYSDALAQVTPIVNASICQNAKVTCGYQPLGGNPVLSFFSGSQLTNNPTLTFTVKSVHMSGKPTLHFTAGSGGSYDTVSRNDAATWGSDGFKVNDYISISGTNDNDAVYKIMGISADGKTLTLDTQGSVQSGDKSGASVYIERAGEITRSSGSWIDDDFVEGEFILVSGTGHNDGYYEIGRIIDDSILELDVSDEIAGEVSNSAHVIGDTADMIRRSAGSWLEDGFRAGQYIKVSGSQHNDGQYRIKSISSDGKIITLDSLTLFTQEKGTGINITIVDYSDTESNTAGLTVHASETAPSGGVTAEAYNYGAGASLVGVDYKKAAAQNTSSVSAWVVSNADITVAGTVEIKADTATRQIAKTEAYNAGLGEAMSNKASATSTDGEGQLNITSAGLQDYVNISALKLVISSYRTDDNYAEILAGSVAVASVGLLDAATADHTATRSSLGTGVKLDVDRLQMLADHTSTFNSKVDAISISGIGLGAGHTNNDIKSTAEANIGPASTILAKDMTVYANNRTNKDWLSDSAYNIRSRSGGVAGVQAAQSTTAVINTTNINVGDGTSIKIPGSIFNLGRLDMEILNTVLARDRVNIDIISAINGAKSGSRITNTNTGTVQIGKNVNIVTAGDLNLSARTYSNIQTYAVSTCAGGAGLADADSRAISTSTNRIAIGQGAQITSYGQINLLAGQSSEGFPNTCYSLAAADVNNWTAVPLKTSPHASGIINLNNYLDIGTNAVLKAVKDANLLTEEGIRVTDGTGTAKNLYSEFVGMDCREIDTDINVTSEARVDGSLEVGIQNQQILVIEADGSVSTQTDGVIFIKTKYEMHTKILEELELARRMREEYSGTAAEDAFEAEIIRLQGELILLGHQKNVDGVMEESVWADYIVVDDIWAQSANINILGTLTGTGTLHARGDAKIEIINKSPAYLRLSSLTIPEGAGGNVMLNRSSLDAGWFNGVNIVSGSSSGEPQITIRNTYSGGNNPDVELYGNIENRGGPLDVSSEGGINSKCDIRAGKVTLYARGDFNQSYVDTFYPVGGEPRNIWAPVTTINEALKWLYESFPNLDDEAIAQVLNAQPQGKIEAANIVISARYLNINGAIISGHPEQRLVLGSDLNSKIANFWRNPRWDYHDNLITQNGGMKAYFDLITQRVIVEGVSAEGGYVSLFGQIMNTGGGRIEALDGYASIHIENHTNYDLQVGALDTGRGSEGMVVIKDTAPMTWLPGSYTAPVTTVYTRFGNQIQIWDDVEMNSLRDSYAADQNVAYNPLTGLRYSWVTAQSKLTQTSTTYRKSTWLGVDWLAKDPGNIYEQSTILLDSEPLLEGEYVLYRPDQVGSAYIYDYRSEIVTQYDGNGDPILDANGNPVAVLVYQDSWVKKKWWGKKTYYLKQVYQKATKDVNYHSIRADYSIPIIFKGTDTGTIDITSDHGLFFTGLLNNPQGTTTVSARGAVEQTEGAYIDSQAITIIGDGGIGNKAALSIDLKGGSLVARALQGIINIQEINGELKLIEVTNTGGDVYLASKGDIVGANANSTVKGDLISLTSDNGGIGTASRPLLIDCGTNSGQGITAQANNSIYLKKAAGDLNLITVSSTAGDVYIEAGTGSILDGNSQFSRDTITEGFVLGTWRNLGLSGQLTAAQLRYLLGVTLKTDRKPDIWNEYDPALGIDINVRGNSITLKALHGAIGQTTGTLTVDLRDLASLDLNSKLALMAADPKDIQYYDAAGHLIAANDSTTLAESAVILQPDEIDVEAGTINAEAGSNIYLGAISEVGIGSIKGGQVRIRSDQGIMNGVSDGSINITSDDLILTVENGAIGAADKSLVLAMKDGSVLRALARDGVYLTQRAAGTGRSGNLNIDYVHTPGDVGLRADASIIGTRAGSAFDIMCAHLDLAALNGSIGGGAKSLQVEQAEGSHLKAVAGTDVFLEELTGNMLIDSVSSGGDVNLRSPGSILAVFTDGRTAVTGNNMDLTAVGGQVGEEATFLVINSSAADRGKVDVSALGNIYFHEADGDLNLGLIRSISKGRVYLSSAGGITNGGGTGTNVDADLLKMEAGSGVGTAGNPIYTIVTRVEGSGGTGGFYLDNQGGLMVGGVDTINGITADGTVQIAAHSPLTVAEDIVAGGDIELVAGDTIGADDLMINAGRIVQAGGSIALTAGDRLQIDPGALVKAGNIVDALAGSSVLIDRALVDGGAINIKAANGNLVFSGATIQSTGNTNAWTSNHAQILNSSIRSGQSITIQAGLNVNLVAGLVDAGYSIDIKAADNILIDPNSAVRAANNFRMAADYGNSDPGTGCKIEIYGTLGGNYVEVRGESDNDEFIIEGATIQGPVTLLGGAGDDLYTVSNLRSISTWHDGKKDRITMNGQDGADLYNINLVGGRDYIVEALDTGSIGTDILTLNGTPDADILLLRQKFIAKLNGTQVERVNYDQGIERLSIYALAGDDSFYLDDNSAVTNIYGAEGNDSFQIGQMFGSARDANAGVAPGDEITTVHTTRGYLSRGVSYETTIYGASGNDSFTVYSNQAHLILEGEDGNDLFVVRAFALADPSDPSRPRTTVNGGDGDDHIEYNMNALVDIDGGTGSDTIRIIGSEFADVFVIDENGIVGAGLNVSSGEVECYEAYGMEGNDIFYIQGTRAGMVTKVFGGYGSDSFYILGDVTRYVATTGTYELMVDHDLDLIQGTLIIEGGVSSEGSDCVLVAGVTLPTENNPSLSDVAAVDESKMTDSMYIYNDDSNGGDIGYLTAGHLWGLGMGTGTTINQGTPDDPYYVDYPGGILFYNLEVVEILLGAGDDIFEIDGTSPGTITAVHGGGGTDKFIAKGYGGPLVIYGDTEAQDVRYSGRQGTPSINGHRFSNPDYDYIDVSNYLNWAVIYGGPGDDYIIGTGSNDCLAGGPGNDWIDGGWGDDLLYGDSGFSVILSSRTLQVLNRGSFGSDYLDGGYGDDIIFGDYGVPCYLSLRGTTIDTKRIDIKSVGTSGGSDYILGGPGDDVLIGGLGADTIDGQAGNDLIFGDNALENYDYNIMMMGFMSKPSLPVLKPEPVIVIRYTNYAQGLASGNDLAESLINWLISRSLIIPSISPEESAVQADFENLVVIRSTRSIVEINVEYLNIDLQPDSSAPWWAKLPLMLTADSYGDRDYLVGGSGNDAIFGQGGDDIIQGDGSLHGKRPWVRVYRGEIVNVYPSASAVTDGHDYIEGGSGNDLIFGNGGNDDIIGGSSDLFGFNPDALPWDGQDRIFGGSGTDLTEGSTAGQDDDAIIGDNGNIYRVLLGQRGSVLFLNPTGATISRRAMEPLNYAPFRLDYHRITRVYTPVPGDVIHGEGGNDFIHGMSQDDFLYGGAGNDHIIGGSGYDTIWGGSGDNRMIEDEYV